jgi:hypothetical protein
MEAPFRFTIQNLQGLEKLLTALDTSPDLIPGTLELTEGMDLLAEQFAEEGRCPPANRIPALFRELWQCPLQAQRPRFLRLEAKVLAPPPDVLSVRVDVPTVDALPRWVDAEGSRDPAETAHLMEIYRRLSEASQLPFFAV